jgi:DNA-binding NarL/FixJ family response regulator
MGTLVLVFAPTNLQQLAWQALLDGQPAIQVSGTVGDTTALANHLLANKPNTILLDLPGIEPQLITKIRSVAPGLGLLYLADGHDLGGVVGLLQAGASGFVSRNASPADLARALSPPGGARSFYPLR